jgi:hypothetical protein
MRSRASVMSEARGPQVGEGRIAFASLRGSFSNHTEINVVAGKTAQSAGRNPFCNSAIQPRQRGWIWRGTAARSCPATGTRASAGGGDHRRGLGRRGHVGDWKSRVAEAQEATGEQPARFT